MEAGEGPGEFRAPFGMAVLPGDSLLVWDARLRRITRLTAAHRVADAATLRAVGLNENFVGAFVDGSVILHWRWFSSSAAESNRDMLVRVDRTAERVDTLMDIPMPVRQIMAFGRPRFETEFLAPMPSVTVGASAIWWTDGGSWEMKRLDGFGRVDRIIRVAEARRPITQQFFQWLADSLAFKGPWPAEEKPEIRRMYDRMGVADSLPAVSTIAVGTDGRIWMQGYQFPGQGRDSWSWLVLEPDGTPVAWADLPRRFTPYEFGSDRVLGVGRDSLDVQYVERYRFVTAGGV